MKTLTAILAAVLLSCGGAVVSPAPEQQGEAALGGSGQANKAEDTRLEPTLELRWIYLQTGNREELRLVQVPVEERFFHQPPTSDWQPETDPVPPCPMCT